MFPLETLTGAGGGVRALTARWALQAVRLLGLVLVHSRWAGNMGCQGHPLDIWILEFIFILKLKRGFQIHFFFKVHKLIEIWHYLEVLNKYCKFYPS